MKASWNEGVIYQIVPDRFCCGGPNVKEKQAAGLFDPEAVTRCWTEPMQDRWGHEFYGGDLRGIIERIPYLKDMGIGTVYCTPVYPSPTFIKYDITDYCAIDPALGTMADFDELLSTLHQNGMRLIIDLVLNHCSNRHPWFLDAISRPDSSCRDWFTFSEYPRVYECWRNCGVIPELNFKNDAVVDAVIRGDRSPVVFWTKKGVDGLRLDCANDLGRELCALIRDTARSINPDVVVIGEVWNYAAGWLDVLDGAQTYYLTDAVLSLLNEKISASQFGAVVRALLNDAGAVKQSRCFNMLASHDYKRLMNTLDGDKVRAKIATLLQFTLPGIPFIYYGEECCMRGDGDGSDPMNRGAMCWDALAQDNHVSWYKKLCSLRKERPELRHGDFKDLTDQLTRCTAFIRHDPADPKQFGIAAVNPTDTRQAFRLFIPHSDLYDAMRMIDWFSGKIIKYTNFLDIELEPCQGMYLIPEPRAVDNYNFYKRT